VPPLQAVQGITASSIFLRNKKNLLMLGPVFGLYVEPRSPCQRSLCPWKEAEENRSRGPRIGSSVLAAEAVPVLNMSPWEAPPPWWHRLGILILGYEHGVPLQAGLSADICGGGKSGFRAHLVMFLQGFLQLTPGDTGLHLYLAVSGVNLDNPIHLLKSPPPALFRDGRSMKWTPELTGINGTRCLLGKFHHLLDLFSISALPPATGCAAYLNSGPWNKHQGWAHHPERTFYQR